MTPLWEADAKLVEKWFKHKKYENEKYEIVMKEGGSTLFNFLKTDFEKLFDSEKDGNLLYNALHLVTKQLFLFFMFQI